MKITYSTIAMILSFVAFIMCFVSWFISGLYVFISVVSFLFFMYSGMFAEMSHNKEQNRKILTRR